MHQKMERGKSIKHFGKVQLVGFRVLCDGEKYIEEIPKAASELKERTTEISNIVHPVQQIGAFIVDTPTPDKDGYWIGVPVSKYDNIPSNMITLTIPSQKYASILHKGPNNQIQSSYAELHKWMECNEYPRSNHSWNIELYQENNDPAHTSNVHVELCDSMM
ncbi:GyrI-like domain-containing protein [Pontibacillus salicampi]|uniref:GyrI-like domain-containing protein n=1 Tax=Pontibacillus salicampi TaxID=1449801 RepID=A0ABV6LRF7_9BACI